jgi:hypothetical protein
MWATWRCRTASRAVEGTGTQGREHRRGQAVRRDQGRWAVRSPCGYWTEEKKKRKREDGRKVWSAAARKNGVDYIPVAPSEARPLDLDAIQADKHKPPPGTSVGGASGGVERVEEGARTGRGNGDGVEVARWIVCRPAEPMKAHNLVKKTREGNEWPWFGRLLL